MRKEIAIANSNGNVKLKVGGLVMLALAIAGAVYMYPELKRYINIKRM